MSLVRELNRIQRTLKSPKGNFNAFGKYKYRSCEDILESVKPLLGELILTITDEITLVGDRYYVKASATVSNGEESLQTHAFAREAVSKKGMDESQVTGAASSYARKYALNGLLCIDDGKDADSRDNSDAPKAKPVPRASKPIASNNPGPFRFPGGKFKGSTFDDVRPVELEGYMDWVNKSDFKDKGVWVAAYNNWRDSED